MRADYKIFFDIVSDSSRANEKRTMLDIYAARQAYKDLKISSIRFVRGSHSLAVVLTHPKVQAELYKLLRSCVPRAEGRAMDHWRSSRIHHKLLHRSGYEECIFYSSHQVRLCIGSEPWCGHAKGFSPKIWIWSYLHRFVYRAESHELNLF